MLHIETENDGIEIYQITDKTRPTDNIYGEQPYSSPDGSRIAVRHHSGHNGEGGLSIVDLADGKLLPVLRGNPRFPAFHAWGDFLYYQEETDGILMLKRCSYATLEKEDIIALPPEICRFSYGTVSPDESLYAVSISDDGKASRKVILFDLRTGGRKQLVHSPRQHFKHEQFARDGSNNVLIQANSEDVPVVNLGIISAAGDGSIDWLPVDAPPSAPIGRWPGGRRYTPRCTGHEAWIGASNRVLLSTGSSDEHETNLWTAAAGDPGPEPVINTQHRFGHVSASHCGKLWIADAPGEEGVPIYIGKFGTGRVLAQVYSKTVHDRNQWSHTHPYLTADNRWLIFTSTRTGLPQVCGARLPDALVSEMCES